MASVTLEQAMGIATGHHRARHLAEAAAIYQQVLAANPNYVPAMNLLAEICVETGNPAQAEALLRRAFALDPKLRAHNTLGHALLSLGKQDEAIEWFAAAIRVREDDTVAWSNLGAAYQLSGRVDEALTAQRRAVALSPDDPSSLCNLAIALRTAGKFDEAVSVARRAVDLAPEWPNALQILGDLLVTLGQLVEADALLRRAIKLAPEDPLNQSNLGILLQRDGKLDAAVESFRSAIRLSPDYPEAHHNLGNTLRELGQIDAAMEHFKTAVALRPNYVEADSAIMLTLHYREIESTKLLEAHQQWEERQTKALKDLRQPHKNSRDPERRLRVGYLSADFRDHPIHYFFGPLIKAHDRDQVEVFCYSDVGAPDGVTARLQTQADVWRDSARWLDAALVERIREDQIDILVDLALHTGGNRLRAMAARPAPVQMSYLGYCSTSGTSFMDYRLTDHVVDPVGVTEAWYTEKLLRLDGGFCCYQPPEMSPAVVSRTDEWITFCSFNNLAKITDEVLGAWCEILRQVPNSRLLIQARGADQASVRSRLSAFFEKHAMTMDRVVLQASERLHPYLATLGASDILLDAYPFNGHTTSCHALWMGVPMVTLTGRMPVSRAGLGLLSMLQLEKLSASNLDEYVSKAVALARSGEELRELQGSLRDRMKQSPLMDAVRFARDIEKAYRQVWGDWCSKR
jgi:protein O-GlcNAc transferase